MKPYIPAILVLLILAVLLGAGFVTTGLFARPEASFNQQVDEKVEQAQRMLQKYEGGQPLLQTTLQRLSTAKAEPSTQPTGGNAPAAGEPTQAGRHDYLGEHQQELDRRREELGRKLTAWGGASENHAAEFDSEAQLEERVQANADLLAKALQTIREAINTSEGELSGSSHPVATRLEALLLYHQADLQRRTAAVHRTRAEAERVAFAHVLASWREADNRVKSIQTELAGTAGGTINTQAPAPTAPSAAPQPATRPAATKKTGAKPSGGGLLKRLGGLFGGNKTADDKPAEPATETPAPTGSDSAAESKPAAAEPPAEAAAPAGPVIVEPIPPIDQRIQQLQAQGKQVDALIAENQKEAERLSAATAELKGRLSKARSQAEAAEKRMMELEDAGADPADPDAMRRFKEQYGQYARTEREASRAADALENGTLRNARPDAQEENEILTGPLVPAKPGQTISPEPGLVALEADLRAVKAWVETRQALRKQIDAQIQSLEARRDQLKADLVKAESWRAGLAKQATARAQAAIGEAIESEKLESEALNVLTSEGKTAINRARQAGDKHSREVQDFHRKQMAGSPQTGFLVGNIDAIAGDLELERALLLAEEANGLSRQQELLAALAEMGIEPGKLAPAKAGNGPASGEAAAISAGTAATQPATIGQTAEAKRAEALKAAEAALDQYKEASGKWNQLWLVHTQMAAAHYLIANLSSGEQAQKERDEAMKAYQLATRDRADRPESKAYREMMEAMAPQP